MQLVEASLLAGDTEVARAVALRIRTAVRCRVPAGLPSLPVPPGPGAGADSPPPWSEQVDYEGFHNRGVEHRFVAGSFLQPGPATDWIRLRVPLLAGEGARRSAASPRRRTSATG